MCKPRIILRCVANYYTRPTQRIIEFSFHGTNGRGGYPVGGLISFERLAGLDPQAPKAIVHLYRVDGEIKVTVSKERAA